MTMRKRLLAVLAALVAILTGYAVYTNVTPYTLEASIEIRATPQQVWAVLTDTAHYSERSRSTSTGCTPIRCRCSRR